MTSRRYELWVQREAVEWYLEFHFGIDGADKILAALPVNECHLVGAHKIDIFSHYAEKKILMQKAADHILSVASWQNGRLGLGMREYVYEITKTESIAKGKNQVCHAATNALHFSTLSAQNKKQPLIGKNKHTRDGER